MKSFSLLKLLLTMESHNNSEGKISSCKYYLTGTQEKFKCVQLNFLPSKFVLEITDRNQKQTSCPYFYIKKLPVIVITSQKATHIS